MRVSFFSNWFSCLDLGSNVRKARDQPWPRKLGSFWRIGFERAKSPRPAVAAQIGFVFSNWLSCPGNWLRTVRTCKKARDQPWPRKLGSSFRIGSRVREWVLPKIDLRSRVCNDLQPAKKQCSGSARAAQIFVSRGEAKPHRSFERAKSPRPAVARANWVLPGIDLRLRVCIDLQPAKRSTRPPPAVLKFSSPEVNAGAHESFVLSNCSRGDDLGSFFRFHPHRLFDACSPQSADCAKPPVGPGSHPALA